MRFRVRTPATGSRVTSWGFGVAMTGPRGQWSYIGKHGYRDLQRSRGQGRAQGQHNPRRDRSGREVLRLQAVQGYWRTSIAVGGVVRDWRVSGDHFPSG